MDPLTALANTLTAYINFAAARFAASTPEQKAALTGIDTKFLTDLFGLAVNVRGDVAAAADKLRGLLHHGDKPGA